MSHHLVFLINTFDNDFYRIKAFELYDSIKKALHKKLQYVCVIVQGGSEQNQHKLIQYDCHYIQIVENLSDHNIYVGFNLYLKELYTSSTFVILHDTCVISETFSSCMVKIANLKFNKNIPWISAHSFGLYNMGVCKHNFVIQRAIEFQGIDVIPKDTSIRMEQGKPVVLRNKTVRGLISYSRYTLTPMIHRMNHNEQYLDGVSKVDSFAINGISKDGNVRWMSYISAFGIYKFIGIDINYQIPIWADSKFHPKTEDDMFVIDDYSISNKMNFVPLLEYQE